jgi:hypothetical protein
LIKIKYIKIKKRKKLRGKPILIIVIAALLVIYFPDYVKADEDSYEPNDGYYEAYDISSNAGKWLSEIGGLGYQNDEDWYEINLSHERLVVYIKGTINIALSKAGDPYNYIYDQSDFNNGMLDIDPISSGIWYIRITGSNNGNWYNLYWDNIVWNYEDIMKTMIITVRHMIFLLMKILGYRRLIV